MTPGARIGTAIDALAEILANPRKPADAVMGEFLRNRRYIGGGDRRSITERVYGVLRRRAQIEWWLERARSELPVSPRLRVFVDVLLHDGWRGGQLEHAIDTGRYRPGSLAPAERDVLTRLEGHTYDHPAQPRAVRLNIPGWIEPHFDAAFGARFEPEVAALGESAPVDLRVNPLKADRERAKRALKAEEVETLDTALSPLGLRLKTRQSVVTTPAFRDGLVEVQDEGSQLVALLVGAEPGMQVVDYCAGAGGKTLAFAARMENKGRVVACDISEGRLERSGQRLRRAGVHNVERRPIDAEGRKWLKRNAGKFDRVLVDAPCTGTGTWRRNPDGRWTLQPLDLEELPPKQAEILDAAAKLVRPEGGWSTPPAPLLPQENERVIERFLQAHPEFEALPVEEVWAHSVGTPFPDDARSGNALRLTPARHGTDGFFAAVLRRRAA